MNTYALENVNANVKRIDIMLFKEFKNIVKKDEKVAAVFSICIKHYNKARNRDLEISLNSFQLILGQLLTYPEISFGSLLN